MIIAILYLVLALAARWLSLPRTAALLYLPLIAADCACNVLCGQSWRKTMSGEAWNHRDDPRWGWCCRTIDSVFGKGHCQAQNEREARYGSVWGAWWATVAGN